MYYSLLKNLYSITFIVLIVVFSASCDGNCKDETIEKVEWITRYEDVYKDTLVSYSILVDKREYMDSYEEVKHTVTINNDNKIFTNRFAVIVKYDYQDTEYLTNETKTTDTTFVEIGPLSSHSFIFYSQAKVKNNFNNEYEILQEDTNFTFQNKVDELKVEQEVVNSCTADVESLKEKYNTIKQLFNAKTNQTVSK